MKKNENGKLKICKKICISLGAILFILIVFPMISKIELTGKVNADTFGDYEYKVFNSGTVEITKYKGKDAEVTIPNEIDGKSVTKIGRTAFNDCENLTSVTIPDSVTSIGEYAFYVCSNLKNINIPSSVTSIEVPAFYDCKSLESINVSEYNKNYKSVDGILFEKDGTMLIKYPENKQNEYYEIPDSVTDIGMYAFYVCSNLKSINIPSSVTKIGAQAFYACKGLESIYVSEDNIKYKSIDGVLLKKENNETRLIKYPENKQNEFYRIPDSVTKIGTYAFCSCTSLKSIRISNNVKVIDADAFCNSKKLEEITIEKGVETIESYAFTGCSSLTSITIPNSVTSIGESAFENCSSLTSITIPDSVTSIKESVFANCINLTSIEIPNSVTSIGENAFYGCRSLEIIAIPDSVTSIGSCAFNECTSLESIKLSNSLTSIELWTFLDCEKLKSIEIPNSVTSIEENAFENCSSLTSITIPDSVTRIGSYAFVECSSLTSIKIPERTSIGNYAFSYCESLTSIDIPDNIYKIGESILAYSELTIVTNKKEIEIPSIIAKARNENSKFYSDEGITYVNCEIVNDNGTTMKITNDSWLEVKSGVLENFIVKFIFDKDKPKINSVEVNPSNYTNQNVTITIDAEDDEGGSGLADKPYSFDGGKTWQAENSRTYSENTEGIVIYVKDKAGNKLKYETTININNIDKTSPIISVTGNPESYTNSDVTIVVSAEDNEGGSGLADKPYKFGDNDWTDSNQATFFENGKIRIQVKDKAGNIAEQEINITKIDKTIPKIESVTLEPKENTNKNVTLKVNATDIGSGVAEYSFDGGKTWRSSNISDEYEENTYGIKIIVKDNVGNESEVKTIDITNINKVPGDINGDYKTNIIDLLLMKRHILSGSKEKWKLTGDKFKNADLNSDGKINIIDLLLLKRIILKKNK